MTKIESVCRSCWQTKKVKRLVLIPTSNNQGLQLEIHLSCGHMEVYQLVRMPIGGASYQNRGAQKI
jgi:hypothetical protein